MTTEHLSKIRHRGVFIERQMQAPWRYLYICHTGISKFLPDLYETQEQAIKAVDAKLDENTQSNFLLHAAPKQTREPNLKAQ